MAVKFEEVQGREHLIQILAEKNLCWFLIVGDGAWTANALTCAKTQAVDLPQFMVLWIKNSDFLTAQDVVHFLGNNDDKVACAIASNGGVVPERLDRIGAQVEARIGRLLAKAECYEGTGYCLEHGEFKGDSCASCKTQAKK